jgi:hypothetical protein
MSVGPNGQVLEEQLIPTDGRPPLLLARDPMEHWRFIERARACFIHVPRVANEFFHLVAGMYPPERRISIAEYRGGIDRWTLEKVQSSQFFAGQFRLAEAQEVLHGETHYLTFLQDPADRLAAEFVASIELDGDRPSNDELDFAEWLERDGPSPRSYRANLQTWILGAPTDPSELDIDPEDLSRDDLETLLVRATRHLNEDLSFVGVAEHYLTALRLFCWTFGIHPTAFDLVAPGLADSTRVSSLVGPEQRARIAELSWADVELHQTATRTFKRRLEAMATAVMGVDTERSGLGDTAVVFSAGADLEPLYGSNVLERADDGRCWYWTGAQQSTGFALPIELGELTRVAVEVRARACCSPRCWTELVVLVDGRPCEVVHRGRPGERLELIGVATPSPATGRSHEVELVGPLVDSPEERDPRRLGVAIEAIVVRRVVPSDLADRDAEVRGAGAGEPKPGGSRVPLSLRAMLRRWRHRSARMLRSGRGATSTERVSSEDAPPGVHIESLTSLDRPGAGAGGLTAKELMGELQSTRDAIGAVWQIRALLEDTAIRANDVAIRLEHLEQDLADGPEAAHDSAAATDADPVEE